MTHMKQIIIAHFPLAQKLILLRHYFYQYIENNLIYCLFRPQLLWRDPDKVEDLEMCGHVFPTWKAEEKQGLM